MDKKILSEQLLLSEIQVLLSEKRTYYAILRTGLGIITVPLTVIIFLSATAQYHKLFSYVWIGAVLIICLLAMSLFGVALFFYAQRKLRRLQKLIRIIENKNQRVDEIVV